MTPAPPAHAPDDRDRPTAPAVRVRTLLAGLAIRPFAQSARRAGVDAASVDLFGDLDHRRALPVLALRDSGADGYSAGALVDLARRVEAREVAYGADLENHPGEVARLAEGRRLLGNPPDVLRRVRDPFRVAASLRAAGLAVPALRGREEPPPDGDGPGGWLRKPLRGGGGRGVRPWRPGEPVPEGSYLQRRIRGLSVSLLFLADGRSAHLLAATEMLVGRDDLGPEGFTYAGSLLRLADGAPPSPPDVPVGSFPWEAARSLTSHLAAEFGLVGLNGVDAVLAGDRPWPVEVNPRWTAAMELLEPGPAARASGEPTLFGAHRRACGGTLPGARDAESGRAARGWKNLPGLDLAGEEDGRTPSAVVGKAVVRSPDGGRARELRPPPRTVLADVPEPGERIPPRGPICTVLAAAPDRTACLDRLDAAAARIRDGLLPEGG